MQMCLYIWDFLVVICITRFYLFVFRFEYRWHFFFFYQLLRLSVPKQIRRITDQQTKVNRIHFQLNTITIPSLDTTYAYL